MHHRSIPAMWTFLANVVIPVWHICLHLSVLVSRNRSFFSSCFSLLSWRLQPVDTNNVWPGPHERREIRIHCVLKRGEGLNVKRYVMLTSISEKSSCGYYRSMVRRLTSLRTHKCILKFCEPKWHTLISLKAASAFNSKAIYLEKSNCLIIWTLIMCSIVTLPTHKYYPYGR
jgi:hypothetical protein